MVEFVGIRPRTGEPRIIPASAYDLEQLERLRPDTPFANSSIFKRSLKAHKWYWGLLTLVGRSIDMHPDDLHTHLKFEAGRIARRFLHHGRLIVELKSEGFSGPHAMDETEAREYRIAATNIIFRDFLDPIDRPEVFRQVEEYVGFPCPW